MQLSELESSEIFVFHWPVGSGPRLLFRTVLRGEQSLTGRAPLQPAAAIRSMNPGHGSPYSVPKF
eukprot:751133-Hanusia_phi.AAC.1